MGCNGHICGDSSYDPITRVDTSSSLSILGKNLDAGMHSAGMSLAVVGSVPGTKT